MTIPSALLASLSLFFGLAILLSCVSRERIEARAFAALVVALLNLRYVAWRYVDTLGAFALTLESLWSYAFFGLELLAVLCATWHVLQMIFPSDLTALADRREAELNERSDLPAVDVFIATYNEAREVVEPTLAAALALDYPRHTVWVLDDGARPWLEALAAERGARYLARTERRGFKAGNLNHGLRHADGELILCLDADFVVKPNFLRRTVGLFADSDVGIVQTPQHFRNADAVQENLFGADAWPDEQRVFFDVMQPSRDTLDNAFCVGTSFVIRRAAVDLIGGFPEGSITEDLYTTYALKERGYVTRYLNEPLSAGLAASDLAEFVKQRCRWCLGTLQCLWLPAGPLRSRRLSLLDRLCLLDPIAFYVSYLYILLTLLAPAVYWWTGTAIFHSDLGHVLNMLAPRMGASMIVLYWISGRRVVPVVSEVGRAVGIFQLSRAVIQGLLRPFSGTFQVTLKGTQRDRPQVQWPLLRPFLLLAAATAAGMTVNVAEVYHPTFWSEDLGMNVALTAFVAWLLFLCCLTCVDRPSRELSTRPGTIHGSLARSVRAVVLRIVR